MQVRYSGEVNAELEALALKSRKFREWAPALPLRSYASQPRDRADGYRPTQQDVALVAERHYTPKELGTAWGLAPDTIREMFQSEPGVLVIGDNGTRNKRRYRTFRIPESVAVRVHRKLSAKT